MRIDKYIWCVRLCKTRSLATKECSSEKVKLNETFVKASKEVKIGDEIQVKRGPIWKRYTVLNLPKNRVGAALVSGLIKEITPWSDLEMLERIAEENKQNRQLGLLGRPTKRTRRQMDQFRKKHGGEI